MTDDEVDVLLSGVEDSQGQVQYEGVYIYVLHCIAVLMIFPYRIREDGHVSLKHSQQNCYNNILVLVFMSILMYMFNML